MEVKTVKISELKPHPSNPREHPDSAIAKLARSIKEFGWTNPVLVSEDGYILAGHARLKAAEKAGLVEIPVIYVPLSGKKAEAYMIADNKLQDLTAWDLPKLKDLLETLDDGQFDLTLTGFEMSEVEDLMTQFNVPSEGLTDDDEIPEKVETICKAGDLWRLGNHRLLCGDATVEANIARLMANEKADMVFTDPPYGVKRQGIANDELEGEEFDQFNSAWLSILPVDGIASFICYHSTRTFPSVLINAISHGWNFERMLWFYRPDKFPAHTWKGWMMVSQAIMLFTRGDIQYLGVAPADQDTYRCTVKELGGAVGHPTEKIVGQCASVMKHLSGSVYDPFGGSGSTLIACEKLGRKCRMMEIEPHYCDVIIQRWQNFTGKEAVKL